MNTLTAAAAALRTTHPGYLWVQPTPDEAEVGDLLDELAALHLQARRICSGCREVWPCAGIVHAEQLAVQWLGRAADRVYARVQAALDKPGRAA